MKLRPYRPSDFALISGWITDARMHALWCANLSDYPLSKDGFDAMLLEAEKNYGDRPYVAVDESGSPVGFFCFSFNSDSNEAMLKFVVIDSSIRGKGYGEEMVTLAVNYAFESVRAGAVHLNVFSVNSGAKRCYEKVGFRERALTENALCFNGEYWDKLNMLIVR